jgi:ribonuclease E
MSAVADLDGVAPEPDQSEIRPEPVALQPELQQADHRQEEAPPAPVHDETAQEAEKAARRRSTVREKVSFLANTQPEAVQAVDQAQPEPPASAAAEAAAETATSDGAQPRKAGWWSRRFGNGE